jgi:hypothetical protein
VVKTCVTCMHMHSYADVMSHRSDFQDLISKPRERFLHENGSHGPASARDACGPSALAGGSASPNAVAQVLSGMRQHEPRSTIC